MEALPQQTIFNVPSVEITPKGALYFAEEAQFRGWQPGLFYTGTTYAAIGIGHETEVNATLFNVAVPVTNNLSLGVGIKKTFPILKKELPELELKVMGGTLLPISLQGQGVGNWTYAMLSGRVPKVRTRLSVGANYGTKQIFGREIVGAIASFEQPITKKLSLIGDWYSGTHTQGLLIVGGSYALTDSFTCYGGVQIPNNSRSGQIGFVLQISKLFK
ncbi:MAG: hypothetical protein SFT81_05435 [Candidatus Caenarcaniphilales bacterium]|nr:hypothetical protein [Candidatus Caenarcaniphilales bacterium]